MIRLSDEPISTIEVQLFLSLHDAYLAHQMSTYLGSDCVTVADHSPIQVLCVAILIYRKVFISA
jgi:hypothetical protein